MDQKMQIKASDEDLKGRYANVAMLSHNKEEFILDFLNNVPPGPLLISRIIISPEHAKRLLGALQEQVNRYESSFGNLDAAMGADTQTGFGFRQEA
jgi:hypothetical protein